MRKDTEALVSAAILIGMRPRVGCSCSCGHHAWQALDLPSLFSGTNPGRTWGTVRAGDATGFALSKASAVASIPATQFYVSVPFLFGVTPSIAQAYFWLFTQIISDRQVTVPGAGD